MDEITEAKWLDAIEDMYGVRLGPNQLYVDRGYVYAGSEYVATPGRSLDPEDATDWAKSIAHFPRGLKRLVESSLIQRLAQ